jgi:poly-gamma-glutamate synthase PgsB/CapB
MNSFYSLLVIIITIVVILILEYRRHKRAVNAIPIRIHINGTRGKSSVTRLIGAGLRAGGVKNITKVTGTFPRLILDDGKETYIHRKASANILEQLSIVKYAANKKVNALVMECMALQPQYQTITEHMMVRSTISVMTNVRLDHTEIMGRSLSEIAHTMGRTIPHNQHLFTSENIVGDELKKIADQRNTTIHFATSESVTQKDMEGFSYIEHRDNVALALAVCKHVGVDKETALPGMYAAIPDAGILKKLKIKAFQKELYFYNAFAANDPDSTFMIWEMIRNEIGFNGHRIILLNTRQDRLDRTKQLLEMISNKIGDEVDFIILIGQSVDVVKNLARGYNIPGNKLISLGWTTPENVFEGILSRTNIASTTVAIGNMGGIGAETAEFFENKSIL